MSQQTRRWLVVAAMLALGINPAFATDHAHGHDDHSSASLTLNNGQKWPTDASLRQGMASIKAALLPQLHAIQENKLKASQYRALAKRTNAEISFMVSNCKLAPEADAQLHLIIADLGTAAEAMAGNDKKLTRQEGAFLLRHALETYGEYFDHPGWPLPALAHGH